MSEAASDRPTMPEYAHRAGCPSQVDPTSPRIETFEQTVLVTDDDGRRTGTKTVRVVRCCDCGEAIYDRRD